MVLPAFTALLLLFLFSPIGVMIAFSFNDPHGRQNITWQGFTVRNYFDLWGRSQITGPMVNSLLIATLSTVVATTFGTLIGLALTRFTFRGRWLMNLLIFIPMTAPEVILGASLLTLWVTFDIERGLLTILAAHIMFNISFVVVTVRARLAGMNRSLEEAGMDLYADGRTTFWKVTFPIIFPGILSAALLAFALSIDDYVITLFSAGHTLTFPLWVFGVSRLGIPPEVNVLGTLIFLPLATPEVVMGASLLSLFLTLGFATGFTTIVIAHIMFNISFVVVTVRSRLIGFDRHLEEAAQDLGANGFQTFMRVTLPLIAPGVFAAALLAFALSIDDFVITNFNAGSTVTFPLFVWGAARVSVPPQIYIIATMIFVATLIFMFLTVLQQRRAARMAAVRPESPEI